MSLLIKALDKAQAEKAQVKNALKIANNKESVSVVNPSKDGSSNEPAADKTTQAQQMSELAKPVKQSFTDTVPAKTASAVPVQNMDTPTPLSLSSLEKNPENPETNLVKQAAGTPAPLSPQLQQSTPAQKNRLADTSTSQVASLETSSKSSPAQKTVRASQQENAANVFYAKRNSDPSTRSQNIKLAIAAGLASLALFGFALYYYLALQSIGPADGLQQNKVQHAFKPLQNNAIENQADTSVPMVEPEQAIAVPASAESTEPVATIIKPQLLGDAEQAKLLPPRDSIRLTAKNRQANDEAMVDEQRAAPAINIKRSKPIASESASIAVTQNKTEPGVNPTLLRAYQAYNAGNDIEANQLYKQVLQRDGLNVDAMLGLGAIAIRQNRIADANDWYQKVLEVEPRNSFAQTALLQVQSNSLQPGNPQPNQVQPEVEESAMKSLLAKSPNDANLHANLGNLYARQKQWASAQQAYFDAYRLNASADNAFNLAISLDQLAKSQLALPYYRQALNLATSQPNGIDLNALTARIHAIELIEK